MQLPTYQYGIVSKVQPGKDGLIRKAIIRYRNANENVDRETNRAVRSLIVIHKVDEVSLTKDLHEMLMRANTLFSNTNVRNL